MATELKITRAELQAAVQAAADALNLAKRTLAEFNALAENNAYPTLDLAVCHVEAKLQQQARDDCEGSYNVGCETYVQEFMVGGIAYEGVLECEYNRHDKTYYYLYSSSFTYSPK